MLKYIDIYRQMDDDLFIRTSSSGFMISQHAVLDNLWWARMSVFGYIKR